MILTQVRGTQQVNRRNVAFHWTSTLSMLYRPLGRLCTEIVKVAFRQAFVCGWASLSLKVHREDTLGQWKFYSLPSETALYHSWLIHSDIEACIQQTCILLHVSGNAGAGDIVCAFRKHQKLNMSTHAETEVGSVRNLQTTATSNWLIYQTFWHPAGWSITGYNLPEKNLAILSKIFQ